MFFDVPSQVIRAADAHDAADFAHVANGGSLCGACGIRLIGRTLCPHHVDPEADRTYAASARILCAFIHRGVEPKRLDPLQRFEWDAIP